jgi:hypothetical protein
VSHGPPSLPRDAEFFELRPDVLTFRTREAVLPGTELEFSLVLEGHPLSLRATVEACLVVEKDRSGYTFHVRLPLTALPGPDRQLISLFIGKGRGEPRIAPISVHR